MAEYVMLEIQAKGTSITEKKFREAINGCRPQQQYKYHLIFVEDRVAVVPFNDSYSMKTFENCVNTNLQRDGGSLEGLVAIYESDLNKFSSSVKAQILQVIEQIQEDGNSVEGFTIFSQNNSALK